jgi:hypothetical protein
MVLFGVQGSRADYAPRGAVLSAFAAHRRDRGMASAQRPATAFMKKGFVDGVASQFVLRNEGRMGRGREPAKFCKLAREDSRGLQSAEGVVESSFVRNAALR